MSVASKVTIEQQKQALIDYWTKQKIGKRIKPETWDENYIKYEYELLPSDAKVAIPQAEVVTPAPEVTKLPPINEVYYNQLEPDTKAVVDRLRMTAEPSMPIMGQPYKRTLWRGVQATGISTDEGMFGKGTYYSTDPDYAKNYSETFIGSKVEQTGKVLEQTVELRNPYVAHGGEVQQLGSNAFERAIKDGRGYKVAQEESAKSIRQTLESQGYDGIVMPLENAQTGLIHSEVVVFYPEKSAIPKAEAGILEAPVTPEVTKPLIAQSYQKRWDTDKLGFRTDLTIKGGWVNNKGQMTKTGERIAQSKWNDLSPAAQNVLKRLIDERYGVAPKVPPVTPEVIRKTYIRIGDLPEGGKSEISGTGKLERGISSYEATYDIATKKYYIDATEANVDDLAEFMDWIEIGRKKVFELSGKEIGLGATGEPLLTTTTIKRTISPDDVIIKKPDGSGVTLSNKKVAIPKAEVVTPTAPAVEMPKFDFEEAIPLRPRKNQNARKRVSRSRPMTAKLIEIRRR